MNTTASTTQVGYGKANFKTRSIVLTAFIVEAPYKRTLVSKRYQKVGKTIVQQATSTPDIGGFFFTEHVEVPEGSVVQLQGSLRANGMPSADAAIFIRVRNGGSALLISSQVPQGGYVNSHVVFSGHGDLLGSDELSSLGIEPPRGFVSTFMDRDEIEEVFTIREVAPAKEAPPKMEVRVTDSGERIAINVASAPRRMRIRRS